MADEIDVRRDGPLLAIRFNRPEKKNAITSAMYEALVEALTEAEKDQGVRVVTITGNGDSFTAGNDLKDFAAAAQADAIGMAAWRFLDLIAAFPKPIVAGVHGNAVGIGTTMLFHCDLILAAQDARFSLPFVDLGLVPEAGSSLLLPRLAGPHIAAKHLMLGESFDAADAVAYGLVTQVVMDDLETAVRQTALRLAAKPPEALRITKALIRGEEQGLAERMAREGEAFRARLASAETAEAIRAFFEKRAPNFG